LLLGSLGSGWSRLGNPLGDGDLLGTYAGRTVPWGQTTGGFPFGMRLFPYFQTLDLIPETMADLVTRITGNPYLGVNLVWLVSFPVCSALACWLFRRFGASAGVAVALSLAYTFIPYHWVRGFAHPYLATMWSAVLGTCVALLIGSGRIDEIWRLGRHEGRLWRGRFSVVIATLIVAWSGIYYAFFGMLLMSAALGWLWVSGATWPRILRASVPLAVVLVAVSGVLVASGVASRGDPPSEPIAVRNPLQSTTYAGAVAFLLTPSPVSSLPGASKLGHALDPYIRPDIESRGYSQFGSVVTTAALALYLIGTAVYARRRRTAVERPLEEASPDLAEQHGQQGLIALLLAVCVFFFVPWSGNFLFALSLSPGIRSWDRLLPIILLLVLVGAVQIGRLLGWGRQQRPLVVATVLISIVMLLDEVAPYPSVVRAALDSGRNIRHDGERYAASINREVPRHCGVLQLPYVPFPEKGVPIGTMDDYQHFLVALTNPNKEWSYGAVKFTRASAWAERLGDRLTAADLAALHEGGFCGVHVDTTGYLLGNQAPALVQLRSLLGAPVATGHGGEWQFYLIPGSGPVHDVKDRSSLSPQARNFFYPNG
jgi:phosphoglycerol transferase